MTDRTADTETDREVHTFEDYLERDAPPAPQPEPAPASETRQTPLPRTRPARPQHPDIVVEPPARARGPEPVQGSYPDANLRVHDTPFGRVYVRTFGTTFGAPGRTVRNAARLETAQRPVRRRAGSGGFLFWAIALFLLFLLLG